MKITVSNDYYLDTSYIAAISALKEYYMNTISILFYFSIQGQIIV